MTINLDTDYLVQKKIKNLLPFFFFFLLINFSQAQTSGASVTAYSKKNPVFTIVKPDYQRSPHTGVTRKHWKDAAVYLLNGAFSYINKLDDPMKFPKQPGKSYPTNASQIPTEMLEGLCRTLFIAAPILKENPDITINKIKLADYYRQQLVELINPASKNYIKIRDPKSGPSQNLVEFGALSISLFIVPEILWDPLSKEQKNALAATMLSYADGPTHQNNWKYFNIFVFSFFKSKGYAINEKLFNEYMEKTLAHYSGDGWYDDNNSYDYYSMWAFQMYGMLWSEFYGKKHEPEYAKKILSNFKDVKINYPNMFAKNGEMIMWGRSISYRFGAVMPLPLISLENDPTANYGWMRRISSGAMLQFLQNPNFLEDKIPTLGFYGAFEPTVQNYSCRGSVFWMGKAFLALILPENNTFWTATENEGPWEKEYSTKLVYNKFLPSPKILITNYPGIGASEIRSKCNYKEKQSYRGNENYNRLSYNSAFPWQADGENGEVAMNYVFKNKDNKWEPARLYSFKKFDNGIYYRNVVLESNPNINLNLADIPLANGILRVDRNISTDAILIRMGHYSLPKVKNDIKEELKIINGREVRIIDNGVYQLAMVYLSGWDKIETLSTKNLNPVSAESAVINVAHDFNPEKSPVIYSTLMLWKRSGERWKKEELMPVKRVKISADGESVDVRLKNGDKKVIRFN